MIDNNIQTYNLAKLWEKYTLNSNDINADFFESGGDSLSAINMIVEIQNIYGLDVSLESFMRNPFLSFLYKAILEK